MKVEQWLGEDNQLGIDIWHKKYQHGDETFDEWLDRISKNDLSLRDLILEKKFLFGGRILANRGLADKGKKITYSNCFIGSTKIKTANGYKRIDEVNINDKVLTHNGDYQNVDNTLTKMYDGDLYEIKTYGNDASVFCTDNHPFLTNHGWKKANELDKNDYIKFSKENVVDNDFKIDLLDYITFNDNQKVEYSEDKTQIQIHTSAIGGNGAMTVNKNNWINKEFIVDNDMKYVFGRWLGDGSITKRKNANHFSIFQIVFNIKEYESYEKCKNILESHLNIKCADRINHKQSTIILRLENAIFAEYINQIFGHGCEDKTINDIRLHNSIDLIYGLIDADGVVTTSGDIRLALKNETLLNTVKAILIKYGIPSTLVTSIKNNKKFYIHSLYIPKFVSQHKLIRSLNKVYADDRMNLCDKPTATNVFFDMIDEDIYCRIKYINITPLSKLEIEIPVYNISVNTDNSYTAENMVVHNCYVIEAPEDNIESIFDCGKKLARTYSYGGGCGIDISKLRPSGSKVNNASESTSGATSFMDLYSMVTQVIGQEGRRGALMISLDCMHPDIKEFITVKSDLDKVTKANLSIRVTDEFMQAVVDDKDITLRFEVKDTGEVIEKTVSANEIFDLFVEMNYDMAEPALLYWDRIKNWNLLSNTPDFEFAGVNPCAEEPLPAFGSCLLGGINLAEFVINPFTEVAQFDFTSFKQAVEVAVKALNDVLDEGLPLHPLQEQRDSVAKWRQIGLGVFGIADMLIKMEMRYDSVEARMICAEIAQIMAQKAIAKSASLGTTYGGYEGFNTEVYNTEYYQNVFDNKFQYPLPLRNSQLLTIAPTGTLSTMLGVSGGIEPIFANSYTRRTQSLHGEDVIYTVYTPIVEQYMKETYNTVRTDENANVILPEYFVTSGDINYKDRIMMQSVWQEFIDASISSTINLPNDATKEDIRNIYIDAWRYGLKGITVYRAGCKREGILIETPKEEPVKEKETLDIAGHKATLADACAFCTGCDGLQRGDIINVSDELVSYKRTIVNGCGKFYLHLDFDDITGEPLETFIDIGSGGGCERNLQFISRLISLLLRAGVDMSEIVDQAFSIRPCKAYTDRTKSKGDTAKGTSCPSAIGWALKDLNDKIQSNYTMSDDFVEIYLADEWEDEVEPIETETKIHKPVHKALCPECAEELLFESGCVVCKNCGYSKCD